MIRGCISDWGRRRRRVWRSAGRMAGGRRSRKLRRINWWWCAREKGSCGRRSSAPGLPDDLLQVGLGVGRLARFVDFFEELVGAFGVAGLAVDGGELVEGSSVVGLDLQSGFELVRGTSE